MMTPEEIANVEVLGLTIDILAKRIDPVNWPAVENQAHAEAEAQFVSRAVNGPGKEDL